MSTLYGWSLDSFYGVDHTYVTSSDGQIWNCWGRSSGGQLICSGTAEPGQADCLSEKNSHAGLLYGLTGVCHQTANRILFPARCIVSEATNYWLTAFVYGTYGLSVVKFQSRLAKCLPGQDWPAPRKDTGLSPETAYLYSIHNLYAKASAQVRQAGAAKERTVFQLLQNECKLSTAYRLGSDSTPRAVKDLLQYQRELLGDKNLFDRALMAKRIKPAIYAEKVNQLANSAFKDLCKSIGEERFLKMFGTRAEIQLIDPAVMSEYYQGSPK